MRTKLFILIMLIASVACAQEFKRNATAGFVFLEIPVTARSASLGETSLALSDLNASAVFTNPASLGSTQQSHSLFISYAPWLAEIKHYSSSYAFNSSIGVFAVGANVFDYGTMPRTVRTPGERTFTSIGTFSANAMAIGISYSKMLTDRFAFGVTTKYVREAIDVYAAKNVVFDGGVLYYTGFHSLRLGAMIQNFGANAQYINDPFRMPAMLRFGVAAEVVGSYDADFRVTTLAEAVHPTDGDERVNLGVEIAWNKMLSLRGGYKFFYDEESYSLGVGFKPQLAAPMELDFAYSPYGRLGSVLRLNLQLGLE